MSSPSEIRLTGSCCCGAVGYTVALAPAFKRQLCNCRPAACWTFKPVYSIQKGRPTSGHGAVRLRPDGGNPAAPCACGPRRASVAGQGRRLQVAFPFIRPVVQGFAGSTPARRPPTVALPQFQEFAQCR